MVTITAQKRSVFPGRYFRKDARTAIYRAVYGRLVNANGERDERYANYHDAIATYNQYRYQADLPANKVQQVEQDIERLKRKPQGGENAP